jgi:hypothetical protein
MRALLALPIAIAIGAWDPCTPPLAADEAGAGSNASIQVLNARLKLGGCVAQNMPSEVGRGSRAHAKAVVRKACVGRVTTGPGALPEAQAAALSDRLVDQEIDYLTKCRE